MGASQINLNLVLIVLFMSFKLIFGEEEKPAAAAGSAAPNNVAKTNEPFVTFEDIDNILYSVTKGPKYFGVLEDMRHQPLSVEVSEGYMDQDYIATNKNAPEMEDFDEDDSEDGADKDKDVKSRKRMPNNEGE